MGLAISTLPPSAAIVSAVRQIDFALSGKASNSFNAPLIHETGRVFPLSSIAYFHSADIVHVVIFANICQSGLMILATILRRAGAKLVSL